MDAAGSLAAGGRAVTQQPAVGEHPVDVLGGLLGRGDESHRLAHHVLNDPGEQRVVGAAEDEGVDPAGADRVEVVVGDPDEFGATGDPLLDELDKPRARCAHQIEVGCGGERVGVGPRLVGADRRDHAHLAVAGRGHGPPHGRADDLDDGHGIPFPGIVEYGSARGVARDDEDLHTVIDKPVETLQSEGAGLGDRARAVGRPGGVAEVGDGFVGELVEDRPGDGEPAVPGVENPDRRITHRSRVRGAATAVGQVRSRCRSRRDGADPRPLRTRR